MSDEQKIYVPKVSAKQITFQASGKTIIKLGIHADTLIEFLKKHKNEKGYVNVGISERKQPGQYGDTHSVWLDTWKPGERSGQAKAVQQPLQPASTPRATNDDVPF